MIPWTMKSFSVVSTIAGIVRVPNYLQQKMRRLRREGVDFANSHAVFPTVTRVNAATLATGEARPDMVADVIEEPPSGSVLLRAPPVA